MTNLEKCALKLDVETINLLVIPNIPKECLHCDGYNNKCQKYTVIKEDCYGL